MRTTKEAAGRRGKPGLRAFWLVGVFWSLCFFAIHFKNHLQVDSWWIVVRGDWWDRAYHAASAPGAVLAGLLFLLDGSVHDYSIVFCEITSLIFNWLIYGSLVVLSLKLIAAVPRVEH